MHEALIKAERALCYVLGFDLEAFNGYADLVNLIKPYHLKDGCEHVPQVAWDFLILRQDMSNELLSGSNFESSPLPSEESTLRVLNFPQPILYYSILYPMPWYAPRGTLIVTGLSPAQTLSGQQLIKLIQAVVLVKVIRAKRAGQPGQQLRMTYSAQVEFLCTSVLRQSKHHISELRKA